MIRFTNSWSSNQQVRDLEIPITINLEKDDVNKLVNTKWIKSVIRSKEPASCGKNRLRLLHNGRILNELVDFRKEVLEPWVRSQRLAGDNNSRLYIQCFIGEELSAEQLKHENELDNVTQSPAKVPEVIGFQRLLEQGFTQDDVNDIHRQFMLVYGGTDLRETREVRDLEEEEQRNERIRRGEEEWINTNFAGERTDYHPQDDDDGEPRQHISLNDRHSELDLLLGLILGCFLGVTSVVFVLADDTVFSYPQRKAIVVGVSLNLMILCVQSMSWE